MPEEWSFVSSYLTLMSENAPQRDYALRETFNALRWLVRTGALWRFLPTNFPAWHAVYDQTHAQTLRSTPESGARAGYDAGKKTTGSKVHIAVDTLGNLLALAVTPAHEQERDQVSTLCEDVQAVTGGTVTKIFADGGYTGEAAKQAAGKHGIDLEIVKVSDAVRGFVVLPKRWIVERSFAWKTRFRRLIRDYERLPETVAGLHFVAFTILMLARLVPTKAQSA